MNSRRVAKAAEAIRETVSTVVLFELKDPRIPHGSVTVTRVEVTGDLRSAKVYVSVMGEPKAQSLCMHGLESARGFIQSKVGDRLQIRYTPILKFFLDQGLKRSAEASRRIREALGDSLTESDPEAADEEFETDEEPTSPVADEPSPPGSSRLSRFQRKNPDDEDVARFESLADEWSDDEFEDEPDNESPLDPEPPVNREGPAG